MNKRRNVLCYLSCKNFHRNNHFIYSITDTGLILRTNVNNLDEVVLKGYLDNGVLKVKIRGKKLPIRKLVALAFLSPEYESCQIRHINGDPFDCRVENLVVVKTNGNNCKPITAIDSEGNKQKFQSMQECASGLFLSKSSLYRIVKGKSDMLTGEYEFILNT